MDWEYPAEDLLEISGNLPGHERAKILRELREVGISADSIDTHLAFSVDGHIVIVTNKDKFKQCWLYWGDKGKLRKRILKP